MRVCDRLPRAAVPSNDGASAILFWRDGASKVCVTDGVVLHVNCHPLCLGVVAPPLGDSPAQQDTVEFEAKVVVKPACPVLLDNNSYVFVRFLTVRLYAWTHA